MQRQVDTLERTLLRTETTDHLFNDMQCSPTPRQLGWIKRKAVVVPIPQEGSARSLHCPEREENEVAVGHVAVLGVNQKVSHDRRVRMTKHHHCSAHTVTL